MIYRPCVKGLTQNFAGLQILYENKEYLRNKHSFCSTQEIHSGSNKLFEKALFYPKIQTNFDRIVVWFREKAK